MLTKDCWEFIASKSRAMDILNLRSVCNASFAGTMTFMRDMIHLQYLLGRLYIHEVIPDYDFLKANFPMITINYLRLTPNVSYRFTYSSDKNTIYRVFVGFFHYIWTREVPSFERHVCQYAKITHEIPLQFSNDW